MATKIEIVNGALTMFGHRRLTSLTAENDTARAVAAVYDQSVLEMLEAPPDWSFARKHSGALALLSEVDLDTGIQPVQGWDYLYAIPSNCVKVRKVFEDGGAHLSPQDRADKQNFEEIVHPTSAVTCIATDIEDAYSWFTAKITDPTQFSPSFVAALKAKLAMELVLPLTQKETLFASMERRFLGAISEGIRINTTRDNPKKTESCGYIDARG